MRTLLAGLSLAVGGPVGGVAVSTVEGLTAEARLIAVAIGIVSGLAGLCFMIRRDARQERECAANERLAEAKRLRIQQRMERVAKSATPDFPE